MREWWHANIELPLNRLPIDWDMLFLTLWLIICGLAVLSGGYR